MKTTYKLHEIQKGVLGLAWITIASDNTSDGFDVVYAIEADNDQSVNRDSSPDWIDAAMDGIREAARTLGNVTSSVRLEGVVGAPSDTTPDAVNAAAQKATYELFGKGDQASIRFDGKWSCEFET